MDLDFGPRFRWNQRPPSKASGIYAFIDHPNELRAVSVPPSGVLYTGMTESSLDARSHFEHAHSGFSTFRRSLGAILKEQLRLRALPRAPGPSHANVVNYRFDAEGEVRLTHWMRENLTYSYREIAENVASVENDLIRSECPPLNLKGWRNPQRAEIKRLRAFCVAEAFGRLP